MFNSFSVGTLDASTSQTSFPFMVFRQKFSLLNVKQLTNSKFLQKDQASSHDVPVFQTYVLLVAGRAGY